MAEYKRSANDVVWSTLIGQDYGVENMGNDYAFAERKSLVLRKLHAQGSPITANDIERDGDYPTIDGMDAADWFEAEYDIDYNTAPTA